MFSFVFDLITINNKQINKNYNDNKSNKISKQNQSEIRAEKKNTRNIYKTKEEKLIRQRITKRIMNNSNIIGEERCLVVGVGFGVFVAEVAHNYH